jgi:hypothetical protein
MPGYTSQAASGATGGTATPAQVAL